MEKDYTADTHAPHNQPFNIAHPKRSSKNGWWKQGHNNSSKKAAK